ncbi:Z1 domain-containing protein [Actinoplanes sp. NBRC 101535]|uniref:Z1 domain-containing protein n=1 Tax=Actinoplanes sp. NBRC 101535 TaxID=3032196 RepID=UPI0024A0C80F|nr:Z1 domain-containing protein [Actinoplanes sp. NBRC 101535]GLY05017.1 endonuclease [Actinoplanes sp. NBRC 101535]
MNESFALSYRAALNAMSLRGPRPIHAIATAMAEDPSSPANDDSLGAYLMAADSDDPLRRQFAVTLATWDATEGESWIGDTEPGTPQRRAHVTRLLEVSDKIAQILLDRFPVVVDDDTVIDGDWTPWYTPQVRQNGNFYWQHYSDHLMNNRGFGGPAIAGLDAATTKVVERLANPAAPARYQSKGLVVGYVQSGKTANFTGVIAKAVDAGYRLIIVLTGSTDLLRAQTQRRLDMELVGRENLLRGISETDTEAFEYHSDRDWLDGKFVQHGIRPSDAGRPDIVRLTTRAFDYRSLQQGISALDFERPDRTKPMYDPVNLAGSNARLVVVKKNGIVLGKLVKDLGKITTRLADIPALIIDDESDQASPNTSNPKKWQQDQKERTIINKRIGELMGLLHRCQYVGYTATPFANVFIDPTDAEDIFPSDFLISLKRPFGYMGAADFQDLDADFSEQSASIGTSNVEAHVRMLSDDPDDKSRLQEAIDAFVLSGAFKLYRESHGTGKFRHHTMLVHHAMQRAVHAERAEDVRTAWRTGGYYSTDCFHRLRELFERDFAPVARATAPGEPIPADFAELSDHISGAVRRIGQSGDPVIVVNSEKSLENEEIDFDGGAVWRILVGGNSLARGFTVEGLTISYYRRMTKQQDTLMQMGRWFGFRPHYKDLVRLYIDPTLHTAFEASCRDEEHFRAELKQYADPVDGQKQVTPAEVPPLVAQHLSWLKPAATNKMYNAELAERRSPGMAVEPRGWPAAATLKEANTKAFKPLIDAATTCTRLWGTLPDEDEFNTSGSWDYYAWIGRVSHEQLVEAVRSLQLVPADALTPDLRWLLSLTEQQIDGWLVILPQQKGTSTRRRILGHEPISVFSRRRLKADYYSAISEVTHRRPIELIKRGRPDIGDEAARLAASRSGAIIIYPLVDRAEDSSIPGKVDEELKPSQVTLAFHLVAPQTAVGKDKRLVLFTTRVTSARNVAIVDRS